MERAIMRTKLYALGGAAVILGGLAMHYISGANSPIADGISKSSFDYSALQEPEQMELLEKEGRMLQEVVKTNLIESNAFGVSMSMARIRFDTKSRTINFEVVAKGSLGNNTKTRKADGEFMAAACERITAGNIGQSDVKLAIEFIDYVNRNQIKKMFVSADTCERYSKA